jgi:hypothetical protein
MSFSVHEVNQGQIDLLMRVGLGPGVFTVSILNSTDHRRLAGTDRTRTARQINESM